MYATTRMYRFNFQKIMEVLITTTCIFLKMLFGNFDLCSWEDENIVLGVVLWYDQMNT